MATNKRQLKTRTRTERAYRMYDTFELLRRVAEGSREAARKLHAGIDPATWEALLDRVEDQLDKDDREDDGVSESVDSSPLHSCMRMGLPLSIFAIGALVAAFMQPAADTAESANQLAHFIAAGAALTALSLSAVRDRHGYRTESEAEGVISPASQPA
ncbi:hypothetical protein ABZ349_06970 [Streptomyces niveus]|uniref:hypothetical protein n=1 Tax=Streptomyces niveus TaxID=193462 RepID=UPI0033C6CA5A